MKIEEIAQNETDLRVVVKLRSGRTIQINVTDFDEEQVIMSSSDLMKVTPYREDKIFCFQN